MRKMETIPSPFSLMSKWGQLRWLEGCRLWRGTWLVNWTGSWLVVASRVMDPWTAAVQHSWWSLSGWCLMISPQRNTTALKTTTREFPEIPALLLHPSQQAIRAKVIGFGNVMTPVVKVINSIRSNRNNPGYSRLLEELKSAECGDLLQHTESMSLHGTRMRCGVFFVSFG